MKRLEFEQLSLYDKLDEVNNQGIYLNDRVEYNKAVFKLYKLGELFVELMYTVKPSERLQAIYTLTEEEAVELYLDFKNILQSMN